MHLNSGFKEHGCWKVWNTYTQTYVHVDMTQVKKVKSAYEPKWPVRLELIPVSVALSD